MITGLIVLAVLAFSVAALARATFRRLRRRSRAVENQSAGPPVDDLPADRSPAPPATADSSVYVRMLGEDPSPRVILPAARRSRHRESPADASAPVVPESLRD